MRAPPDHPDEVVRRVLILSRIIQLQNLALRTSRTFERALVCTELTPAEVAAEMELRLDCLRDCEPPSLAR